MLSLRSLRMKPLGKRVGKRRRTSSMNSCRQRVLTMVEDGPPWWGEGKHRRRRMLAIHGHPVQRMQAKLELQSPVHGAVAGDGGQVRSPGVQPLRSGCRATQVDEVEQRRGVAAKRAILREQFAQAPDFRDKHCLLVRSRTVQEKPPLQAVEVEKRVTDWEARVALPRRQPVQVDGSLDSGDAGVRGPADGIARRPFWQGADLELGVYQAGHGNVPAPPINGSR